MKLKFSLCAALLCAAPIAAPALAQEKPAATPQPTPQQEAAKRLEKALRDTMTACGLGDKPTQDAVVACALTQDAALRKVRDAHRAVAQSLLSKEARGPQVAALLNNWRAAVEDAKDERAASLKTLREKTDYTKKPALEAILTMTGLLGDEASFIIGPEGHIFSTLANPAAAPEVKK